jgi:hypothetical protein
MQLFGQVRARISEMNKEAKGRCWDGYEPVSGKEPYSPGSCQPVGGKKPPKDKKKDDKKKKAMSYTKKAMAVLSRLGGKGVSQLGGGKGLPAGKIGDLFPGQKPISPNFNSSEIEKLLPLILNAQNKGLSAGTIGKLFPGQKPIA